MISFPLFRRNLISSIKLIIIFLLILVLYNSVIIYMFDPDLADMLNDYQKIMPEMMAAVGMTGAGETMIEFIHTYLYGFIMLLIPMIFTIVLTNKLLMKYIDNGSMACILATPNSRGSIIFTQLLSIIISITVLITAAAAIGYACSEIMFPGELDVEKYIQLNGSTLLFQLAIGGIAFFAACMFNESKGFFVIGAGLPLVFYIIQMMANMGGDLENLKYATIFTLFPGSQIIAGDSDALMYSLILSGIAFVLYTTGAVYFTKKDLPL